jgi:uncharacterized protein (TIGR00251 family)
MTDIKEQDGSVIFDVRVIPRSSKNEVVGEHDGAIRIKLKSPPVDGAANEELIRLLSKQLDTSRSDIEIISGHTSRTKRVRINRIEKSQILAILKAKS